MVYVVFFQALDGIRSFSSRVRPCECLTCYVYGILIVLDARKLELAKLIQTNELGDYCHVKIALKGQGTRSFSLVRSEYCPKVFSKYFD